MVGQTIAHYTIVGKLGEGGMGVVYKAQDTTLDRFVALKFLPSQLSASEEDKARFIQEAKAAASLNHPNVCTIFGVGEHEEPPSAGATVGRQIFIEMEFVEGQTLGEKFKSQTTNSKTAIEIGIQIADGLAAAHEKGIIHRDLKPENIMVQRDGRVKIMDFGLAKLKGVSRLTKAGSTVGTAGYMSPEQVQGLETDHRTDIFSMGVILYELFAGHSPFKGVHETAINYEIVNIDPQPITALPANLQDHINDIVLSCLSKDVTDRHQSAAEVARLLRRTKQSSSSSEAVHDSRTPSQSNRATPPRGRNTERWVWGVVSGFLVLALVVTGYFLLSVDRGSAPTIRFTMSVDENATSSIALSRDGSRLAFVASGIGKTLLWIRRLDEFTPRSIDGTEGASNPFWSPDGRYLAFFSAGKLKKVDMSGGAPITICDAPNNRGGSWNQFGEIVFAPHGADVLYIVSSAGGTPRPITNLDTIAHEAQHLWPFFLPDGKRFLFSSRRYDHDQQVMYLGSLEGNDIKTTVISGGNALFSPPDFILFLNNRSLVAQRIDLANGSLIGDPSPIAEDVGYVPLTGLSAFSVSANGVLATGGGRSEERVYAWFDRNGAKLTVVSPANNFFDIALSPDEKRAAVQLTDLRSGNSDIFLIDVRQSILARFTFSPNVEDDPIWSPDGSRIVYRSVTPEGEFQIFLKPMSGTGEEEQLPVTGRVTDWSNDGKYLLVDAGGDMYFFPMRKDGRRTPFLSSAAEETEGQFSPNVNYVAYSTKETGSSEVFVRTFPDGNRRWQVSRGGGGQPRWRKDGKELFYIAPDRTLMAIPVSFANGFEYGAPAPLFRTLVDDYDAPNRYVVSNDGKKFLINVPLKGTGANPVNIVVNWHTALDSR